MAKYKKDPNCPVCQHADCEKIDALLAFQYKGRVSAPAHVAGQFPGLFGGQVSYRENHCLFPPNDERRVLPGWK